MPLLRKPRGCSHQRCVPQKMGARVLSTPTRAVFWSGKCHSAVRKTLQAVLTRDKRYNFKGVRPCDKVVAESRFFDMMLKNTWVLAPPGTYYASFIMYQTLSLGRLPVLVVDFKKGWKVNQSRTLNSSEIFSHLPYASEIDWERLAVAISAQSLPDLGALLAGKDAVVPEMLQYAASVRHMFSVEGVLDYMRRWLQARSASSRGAAVAPPKGVT